MSVLLLLRSICFNSSNVLSKNDQHPDHSAGWHLSGFTGLHQTNPMKLNVPGHKSTTSQKYKANASLNLVIEMSISKRSLCHSVGQWKIRFCQLPVVVVLFSLLTFLGELKHQGKKVPQSYPEYNVVVVVTPLNAPRRCTVNWTRVEWMKLRQSFKKNM